MESHPLARQAERIDDATILKSFKEAHERLVDNPRAFSKNVQGFTPAQSWFVDLAAVSLK